ncbi:hypothetical protein [Saccharopolyspora sp. 5N708]|uniref:hypothetical protein n=1 Tax=Saccharopolyspora sp. 5N708 TaxID=3457424 RepID=UPI003FD4DD18
MPDLGGLARQSDFSANADMPVELDPEQPALIQFSSGTTGAVSRRAKGPIPPR